MTAAAFGIRAAHREDLGAIREVALAVFPEETWDWDGYRVELERERPFVWVAVGPDGHSLPAGDLGGYHDEVPDPDLPRNPLLGFLVGSAVADELHMLQIAVRPERRREGIGEALLRQFMDALVQGAFSAGYLEVRASNRDALGLYLRHGFSPVARRRRYYQSPVEDALILAWTLSQVKAAPNAPGPISSSRERLDP